jgi:hypothetical protein
MRSCKNQLLVRCLLLLSSCVDYYHQAKQSISDFFYYIVDYYYGHHDTWIFVSGHSLPISLNNFYNINHISWIYNNSTSILEKASNDTDKKYYKLSWLSAKIIVHDPSQEEQIEYDIDSFLSSFLVKTSLDCPPNLQSIFHAWCASKKYWFHPDSTIEFYVIDEMGEDVSFNLYEYPHPLVIKKEKLYVLNHA